MIKYCLLKLRWFMKKRISVVVFQEQGSWVAQGLEFDFTAQAKSINDVLYKFQEELVLHICTCKENHIEPFSKIKEAPRYYWRLYAKAFKVQISKEQKKVFYPSAVVPETQFALAA